MKMLIDYFEVKGLGSYPDSTDKLTLHEKVEYQGSQYYLATYTGDLSLQAVSYDDYLAYQSNLENLIIPVTNIQITGPKTRLVGNIYWTELNSEITLTAACDMPDGELMAMIEKVVNADQVVDDKRSILTIQNNVATMTRVFKDEGNYLMTESRLNEGLERIHAPFRVSLERDIEIDVYA